MQTVWLFLLAIPNMSLFVFIRQSIKKEQTEIKVPEKETEL